MPLPSKYFGVTAKQLLVLVTVGCVAAYLIDDQNDTTPHNLALEGFIRSQEQVAEQVGAVLEVALVRQVVAHPGYNAAGYTRSEYAVEGERGRVLVTLKSGEGDSGVEVTQIRAP
ncbi:MULTISPECIES: hypothetical protein [Pseudomonas]|uniref:hypothetical protein n=1 Tax=Pseudomonas TaxID=286 RepID=UPI000CFBE987|nr:MULTISPECIES: hypothetical protein [Pseudomonas]PQZ85158.1 hypothetical protein CQ048_24080 [Pseudomonas trivialis]PRB20992.1 hypothetical protein CQ041_24155 [Pseudomonas sp. MYb60]